MQRREFVGLLGSVAAWPAVARAQQTKVYRIGVLLLGTADAESFRKEMREGLSNVGYVEKHNLCSNSDPRKARSISYQGSLQSWSRSR